jgi:hypothetical protein
MQSAYNGSSALSPDSPLVEGQLLALQNIPIDTSALAGARRNDSIQTTSLELPLQRRLDLADFLESFLLLAGHTAALLDLLLRLLLLLPPTTKRLAIMRLIPLAERSGIDLDDGGLGEGVGTDELVVRRMVCDGDDTHFPRDALGAPAVVAGIQTQGTELAVAAAGAHQMDTFGTDTGLGRLTTLLESSMDPMSEG